MRFGEEGGADHLCLPSPLSGVRGYDGCGPRFLRIHEPLLLEASDMGDMVQISQIAQGGMYDARFLMSCALREYARLGGGIRVARAWHLDATLASQSQLLDGDRQGPQGGLVGQVLNPTLRKAASFLIRRAYVAAMHPLMIEGDGSVRANILVPIVFGSLRWILGWRTNRGTLR
jgi:hypothetical protein